MKRGRGTCGMFKVNNLMYHAHTTFIYLSLLALHLSGTPSQSTGTRPPSCLFLDHHLYMLQLQLLHVPVFITYLATVYTKGYWLDNPFVVAILGTKFLTACVQSAKIMHNSEKYQCTSQLCMYLDPVSPPPGTYAPFNSNEKSVKKSFKNKIKI